MRVLNLVTNDESDFYQEQVDVLESNGVDSTTLAVPGDHEYGAHEDGAHEDGDGNGTRSVVDYLKFYPPVLKRSFDGYDLIHANYGLTAPAAIAQPNLPVVLSLWGSDLMGKYGQISAWCAEHCDAVIVMSEDMARYLECECHVIPHGIDMEKFRPLPQREAREELGWSVDDRQVLFPYPPGREVKNYPRAERVVDRVRERLDDDVVLQTASGVPHERMALYFNAADALLLTSDREGSPNTVKEAMACNLPVVATDVGDVRERLADVERSAVGTDEDELVDELARILASGERSNGREAVRPLSSRRMGERIRDVYRDVLDE